MAFKPSLKISKRLSDGPRLRSDDPNCGHSHTGLIRNRWMCAAQRAQLKNCMWPIETGAETLKPNQPGYGWVTPYGDVW